MQGCGVFVRLHFSSDQDSAAKAQPIYQSFFKDASQACFRVSSLVFRGPTVNVNLLLF